jgi:hypothetical protein
LYALATRSSLAKKQKRVPRSSGGPRNEEVLPLVLLALLAEVPRDQRAARERTDQRRGCACEEEKREVVPGSET